MTTFIKTKFKISDDQTNIDKYRFIANITEYHIISKEISFLESPSNFQVKEKKYSNLPINKKLDFCGSVSHLRESTISDLKSTSNSKSKNFYIEIGPETTKFCFN